MRHTHLLTITDSEFDNHACGYCSGILYGGEDICPVCGSFVHWEDSRTISSDDLKKLTEESPYFIT